jgi:polysaccharide biosynthesis transport protein
MITGAEAGRLLRSYKRWWWVSVLAVALAAGTAFVTSLRDVRYYVATATLVVGNSFESTLPDERQISLSSALARFYGELAGRKPILESVVTQLQLPFSWDVISQYMLSTSVNSSASLLEITVTDSNPQRAAAIANAIGDQLIRYSPASPDKIQSERVAVEQQIADSTAKIRDLEQQIAAANDERNRVTAASDLTEINNRITQLNLSLQQEQEAYRSLLSLKNNSIVNSLAFFEQAAVPTTPLPSRRTTTVAIAGIAGLLLSLLAIYILDRLDTRVRTSRDVEDRFALATLGDVPIGPPIITAKGEYAQRRQRAIHDTHTQILLATSEIKLRTLLVSSPEASEHRSVLSFDLAHLFASSGYRVLLVDADLANPTLTRMVAPAIIQPWTHIPNDTNNELWVHLRQTAIPNLTLLPGRIDGIPGLPTLVPSLRWGEIVEQLRGVADVVIFDGPSALTGADAALIAPHVDAVALALLPATDSRDSIEATRKRMLHNPKTRLIGAVTMTAEKSQIKGAIEMKFDSMLALPAGDPPPPEADQIPAPKAAGPVITPAPFVEQRDEAGDDDLSVIDITVTDPPADPQPRAEWDRIEVIDAEPVAEPVRQHGSANGTHHTADTAKKSDAANGSRAAQGRRRARAKVD